MAVGNSTIRSSLRILDLFCPQRLRWTVSEIAAEMSITYATANRYVNALKSSGLLEAERGSLVLAPRLLYLAELVHQSDHFAHAVRATVDEVADQTGETVIANRLVDHSIVGVVRAESHRVVRFSFEPGQRMPLNAGAAAKAIMAFLPASTAARLLSKADWRPMTESTITNPVAFDAELALVREQGWAESTGEVEQDIYAMAVPVFFPWREVAGSLCLCGPTFRMDGAARQRCLAALREGAAGINRHLADQPRPRPQRGGQA